MVTVKSPFSLHVHSPHNATAWQVTIISYLHNLMSSSENAAGMLGIIAICFAIPLSTGTRKTATTRVPETLPPRVLLRTAERTTLAICQQLKGYI